jgi:hypothetical protein
MATMSNNKNLLIWLQIIYRDQTLQVQFYITQLNDIFNLYLKNNPALLYAKLEDVLQSLEDRIGGLKDTMQMLCKNFLLAHSHPINQPIFTMKSLLLLKQITCPL